MVAGVAVRGEFKEVDEPLLILSSARAVSTHARRGLLVALVEAVNAAMTSGRV